MAKSSSSGTKITRSLTEIKSEISNINNALKSSKSSADNFAKALKIDPHNPALLSKYYSSVKDEIAQCNTKVNLLKEAQDKLVQKNGDVAKTSKEYKSWESQIEATKAKVTELNSALQGTNMLSFSMVTQALSKVANTAKQIVSTIKEIGTEYASNASEISKYSKQFGVDAETYQKQAYVWEKVTDDASAYTSVLKAAQGIMSKVSTGNQKIQTDLANIGLTLSDLKGKDASETLSIICSALDEIDDAATRSSNAMALFGETAGSYVATYAGTASDAIASYNSQINETGVLTEEQVEKGANLEKTFDKIKLSVKQLVATVGEALIPIFEQFSDLIVSISPVIQTIAKGLSAIGPAGVVAVGAFISVMSVLPTLVTTMAAFKFSLGDIASAVGTLAILATASAAGAAALTALITNTSKSSTGTLGTSTSASYSNVSTTTNNYYTTNNDNSTSNFNISKSADADEVMDILNDSYLSNYKIGG